MSEDVVGKQIYILDEKIDNSLFVLEQQLNNIKFTQFIYINNVYSLVNHLIKVQKSELTNYIFDNFKKDTGNFYYDDIAYESFYNLITFRLQCRLEERNSEFGNLCQKFLDDHYDDYKFLPIFQ